MALSDKKSKQKDKDEIYWRESKKQQECGSVEEPVVKNWIQGETCKGSCHCHLNLGLEGLDSETPK